MIQTPEPFDDARKKGALFQLAASMRNSRITQYVQVIHRARVPVISFETQPELGECHALPCYDFFTSADSGIPTHSLVRRLPQGRYQPQRNRRREGSTDPPGLLRQDARTPIPRTLREEPPLPTQPEHCLQQRAEQLRSHPARNQLPAAEPAQAPRSVPRATDAERVAGGLADGLLGLLWEPVRLCGERGVGLAG